MLPWWSWWGRRQWNVCPFVRYYDGDRFEGTFDFRARKCGSVRLSQITRVVSTTNARGHYDGFEVLTADGATLRVMTDDVSERLAWVAAIARAQSGAGVAVDGDEEHDRWVGNCLTD